MYQLSENPRESEPPVAFGAYRGLYRDKFTLLQVLLVADLTLCRSRFNPRPVYAGFVQWTKWHWDRFFSQYFSFSLSGQFDRCSIPIHSSTADIVVLGIDGVVK